MKSIMNGNLYKSRNTWVKNIWIFFSLILKHPFSDFPKRYFDDALFFFFSQIMLCFNTGNKILCAALYLLFSPAVFSDLHKKAESNMVKLFGRSLLSSKVTEFKSWNKFQTAASFKFGKAGLRRWRVAHPVSGRDPQRWSTAPSPARRAARHRGEPQESLSSLPRSV